MTKLSPFGEHVDLSIEKALKRLGMFRPLLSHRSKVNEANKLMIYRAIIRCVYNVYACPVWSICVETHLIQIQKVQNGCLKLIFDLPKRFSTVVLHERPGVPTIRCQIDGICGSFKSRIPQAEYRLILSLQ